MNIYRNRLVMWFVFTALIVAAQVISIPLKYSHMVEIPFYFLSLLLLVALQGCFVNWHSIKQIDVECPYEETDNKLEFIGVWSRLMLVVALVMIAIIGVVLKGFFGARYLIAEVAVLVFVLLGNMVLNPGLKNARVLLANRNEYSEHADAIYLALLCNCFIVAIPYLVLSFQLFPLWGPSRRFYSYM